MITTFQAVPKGTEGAVSLEGTFAGVIGSLILSVLAFYLGLISNFKSMIAIMGEAITFRLTIIIN